MMISKIRTEAQYNQVMALIETFITKATAGGGFHSLSQAELDELNAVSLLAEQYEDEVLKIMPLPVTIKAVVQHKIKELNLTQAKLAEMLGMEASKLSEIFH